MTLPQLYVSGILHLDSFTYKEPILKMFAYWLYIQINLNLIVVTIVFVLLDNTYTVFCVFCTHNADTHCKYHTNESTNVL